MIGLWINCWCFNLIGGTLFLIILGLILRLVGVEYDLQKKEAAYRKILVIAEDDGTVRPKNIEELFDGVRSIHFLSYIRYLYFNIGRIAYLQLTSYLRTSFSTCYSSWCSYSWCNATNNKSFW